MPLVETWAQDWERYRMYSEVSRRIVEQRSSGRRRRYLCTCMSTWQCGSRLWKKKRKGGKKKNPLSKARWPNSTLWVIVLVGSYLPVLAAIPGYTKLFKAIYQHQLNENYERDLICTLLPQITYQRQSHHEFQRDLISTAIKQVTDGR